MQQDKKKIAKNSLMLFVRMGVTVIVSLFTSRIVLQQLGVSDFGIYNVVGGIVALMTFINASMAHGIQRYINYFKARGDLNSEIKIFSASILCLLGIALLILIVGETIGVWFMNTCINIPPERIIAANWVYQLSLMTCVITLFQTPFTALIIAHEDMQIYAYISFVEVGLKLAIIFLLCISLFDKLILYAVLMMFVAIIVETIYMLYSRHKYMSCRLKIVKEKSVYADLLSFSGWTILGTSANIISVQGMNIILNIFFGTIVNAARGIAVQVSTQLDNLVNNIQVAMNPQLIQLYSVGKIEEMQNLLLDNFKWNFYLFWVCGCPILFNTKEIIYYWLGEVPEFTVVFTQFIIIRSLLKVFERPLITATMAYGHMKYPGMISGAILIAEVVAAWILFKIGFSPYWAYIVDLIGILGCIIYDIAFLQIKKIFSFSLFIRKALTNTVVIISVSVLLSYFVCLFFSDESLLFFAIRMLMVVALCMVTIYTLGLSTLQRQYFRLKLKQILHGNH